MLLGDYLTKYGDGNVAGVVLTAANNKPIWLVHAKDDGIVLPWASKQLKAVRSDAMYSLYDIGGHSPHWENSERFNQELAEFARRAAQNSKN